MTYSVEQLAMDDVERLRNLRLRSLSQSPEAFCSTYQQIAGYSPEIWQQQLIDMPVFVAVREASDIGMIRCKITDNHPKAAQLYSLWVNPEDRGKGVGDILVEAVASWSRDHHCRQLILDVIAENSIAKAFYLRIGFTVIGEFCAYPGIKNNPVQLRMSLDLAAKPAYREID